jgi:biotin operon repressor
VGTNHPISGRKARAALGSTQDAVNKQAQAIVELARQLRETRELLDSLRAALGSTQDAVNKQAQAIVELARQLRETRELLDSLLERGFLGRLRWLFTGR